MSEGNLEEIEKEIDESIKRTVRAQSYTEPDGASVTRPSLDQLIKAKKTVGTEAEANKRGGFYRPLKFNRE